MNEITIVLSVILGLILRVGIPVGITLLLGRFVHRLDARWQAEAKEIQETLIELEKQDTIPPCWKHPGSEKTVQSMAIWTLRVGNISQLLALSRPPYRTAQIDKLYCPKEKNQSN